MQGRRLAASEKGMVQRCLGEVVRPPAHVYEVKKMANRELMLHNETDCVAWRRTDSRCTRLHHRRAHH